MRIISQKYLEVSEFIHTFALPNINHKNELENIQNHIYNIRGQRVMLDFDLAHIYEVETKALNQAVKRNYKRFEGDEFMFQLTSEEWKIFTNLNPQNSDNGDILDSFSEDYNLRSRIVTSRFSNKWGGNRLLQESLAVLLVLFNQQTRRILNFLVLLCHLFLLNHEGQVN